jgi:hypothetical protein
MTRLLPILAIVLPGLSATPQAQAMSHPQPTDALVMRLADPSLDRATPDGLDSALDGTVRFDQAPPTAMTAPFCAVTLAVRQDGNVADGIANFSSDATAAGCPTPHLRRLALTIATDAPGHLVDLLRDRLGNPTENRETPEGTRRVSWTLRQNVISVQYDSYLPKSAAISLVRRPAS